MSSDNKSKELKKKNFLLNRFYRQFTIKRLKFLPYYLVREGLQNGNLPEIKTSLEPCETIILDVSDFREIAARKERDMSEEEMVKMKEKGLVCMGIRYNNQIVSYGWYEIGHLSSNHISIPLKEDEAYLSGARTMPSFKGKNLAAYLRYKMYEHLAENGIHTCYSLTSFSNIASLRFKQKLGAKNLKLYVFIRLTKKIQGSVLLRSYPVKDQQVN